MHCGEKFQRSWQSVGKTPPFLLKKCLEILSIVYKLIARANYCLLQCLRSNPKFVENKCNFLNFLLQQNFALLMTYKVREGGIVIRPVTSLGSQGAQSYLTGAQIF